MGRRELARRRRRRGRFGEDGKKRRSLNLADPLREKLMRLFKVRRNSMLEVDDADGAVRTTTNDSSVNCKLFRDALLYIYIFISPQMVDNKQYEKEKQK